MTDREPDLELAGFSLWTKGRLSDDRSEPYGYDTLKIHVRMQTWRSTVSESAELSASNLALFNDGLALLSQTLDGEAVLEAGEAETLVALKLTMRPLGHVDLSLELRSYLSAEQHAFRVEIDQTYLENFARQVRVLTAAYPPSHPSPQLPRRANRKTPILDLIFGKQTSR